MAELRRKTITFRDAQITYRNFKGEESPMNRLGDRNFNVVLDEVQAQEMMALGLNVRQRRVREGEEDEPLSFTSKVKVSYKQRAPRIWLISSGGRAAIWESGVELMDQLEFTKIDFEMSLSAWEFNHKTGMSAYLESMYCTLYESSLDLEYAAIPEVPMLGTAGPQMELGDRPYADFEGEVVE